MFDVVRYFNDNISWWHNVYGFDMECMRDSVLKEAQIDVVPNDEIISPPALLKVSDIAFINITCRSLILFFILFHVDFRYPQH